MVLDTKDFNFYAKTILQRGGNLRPVFVFAKGIIIKSTADNFRAGGRPDKWEPLKPATLLARTRKGKSTIRVKSSGGRRSPVVLATDQPILQATGTLRNSIISAAAEGHVEKIDRNSLEIGTNLDYARAHNFGVSKNNLPARPYIFFQKEDIENITAFTAAYSFNPGVIR